MLSNLWYLIKDADLLTTNYFDDRDNIFSKYIIKKL